MNTFGRNLTLTTFGESHGPAIGGILDGFPPGIKIDFRKVNEEVSKRRPGSSSFVTQRKETDIPEFLSGFTPEGITLGTPIGFIIRNNDNRSRDYSEIENKYRPNHADFTYEAKYGIRDFRGGGRASARETANWVVAGAIVEQWLALQNIEILSILSGVGNVAYSSILTDSLCKNSFSEHSFSIPDHVRLQMENEVLKAKKEGDSIGGVITCIIKGLPAGVGDPVFDKLHTRLAAAMMSINAAKGFEYGLGFKSATSLGSEVLDLFETDGTTVFTKSNYSGGIQGGISNGMPVFFNVYFKPTPTIMKELQTVSSDMQPSILKMRGRHDPCVAIRAVQVVKAMAALVVADLIL